MKLAFNSSSRPTIATEVLDDATSAYVARAHFCFETFQDTAGRLAGLLILLEFGGSRHSLDHPGRSAVKAMLASGLEEFRELRATQRAGHFHRHLQTAGELLQRSLLEIEHAANASAAARDPLPPLRRAWEELTHASKCLPGFEVVDFSHSCCAVHRG